LHGEVDNIKRLVTIALFLLVFLLLSLGTATAGAIEDSAADKLYEYGLFQGVGVNADGSPDFALEREPTRAEAVVMLVRLIGKEAEALSGSWTLPFTDVPEWAKPYVGYAFEYKLVFGVDSKTFASNRSVTATEYITIILRSLGYASGTDFEWNEAWILSDELGITNGEYRGGNARMSRGGAAEVSLSALGANLKGTQQTLYSYLADKGVITDKKYNEDVLGSGTIADAPVPMERLPAPPAAEAPVTEVHNEETPGASDFEREVYILVNKEREKHGLGALEWDEALAAVARAHSADMSRRGYFSHITPEGLRPADRKRAAGMVFRYSAENIARGYRTPEAVVAAWMNSPSHKGAILSESAVKIGVGFHNYYWTLNLTG